MQIFVYGDSLQNNLVAIVVPEKAAVEKWASDNGVAGSFEEILTNAKIIQMYLDDFKRLSKEAGVSLLYEIDYYSSSDLRSHLSYC
mgnify:CR=1 FL=1